MKLEEGKQNKTKNQYQEDTSLKTSMKLINYSHQVNQKKTRRQITSVKNETGFIINNPRYEIVIKEYDKQLDALRSDKFYEMDPFLERHIPSSSHKDR